MKILRLLMIFAKIQLPIQTLGGVDWQTRRMGDPTYSSGPASEMGFSSVDLPESNTDTVLEGEIGDGTMKRSASVFAHTSGTSSYTVTRSVIADRPITLYRMGIFSEDGILVFVKSFGEPMVLTPGDPLQVTHTITVNQGS